MSSFLNERLKTDYGITIGIHNKHRSGKTITSTALTVEYLDYRDDIKGVISNYELMLEPIDKQDMYIPMKDIRMISGDDYKNYMVLTDEFNRFCDSRMSSSFKNMFISNILQDTGKLRQVHILTDQNASAVDLRVRNNADIVLYPEINAKRTRVRVKMFETYKQFFYVINNGLESQWNAEFFFDPRPYYKFYDTEQKIEDYYLTFSPEEYAEKFISWLKDTGLIDHPDLSVTTSLIKLWKRTKGDTIKDIRFISSDDEKALLEYIRYFTDLPMRGKTHQLKKVE